MPANRGTLYTIGFAAAVCVVCAILVSVAAVTLRPRQQDNRRIDSRRNVLLAAGLIGDEESPSRAEIEARFDASVRPVVVVRQSGAPAADVDPATFDPREAADDPLRSEKAPPNRAKVARLPKRLLVYEVFANDRIDMYVLPVSGAGLWSTLYGYLALDADAETIRGIAFYEHGETPGLGGEVDNPRWRARWRGRLAYGRGYRPRIQVIKGPAGPPEQDPHSVDGLTGATLTSRGVSELVRFWLDRHGYGPFVRRARAQARGEP